MDLFDGKHKNPKPINLSGSSKPVNLIEFFKNKKTPIYKYCLFRKTNKI